MVSEFANKRSLEQHFPHDRDAEFLWKEHDEVQANHRYSKQMSGVPCIRALRIPVATIVGMVADGMTATDILAAYPDLEREDIQEALHFDGGD